MTDTLSRVKKDKSIPNQDGLVGPWGGQANFGRSVAIVQPDHRFIALLMNTVLKIVAELK